MFRDVSVKAIFHKSEIHPEAKTLKDFHDDLENALKEIRTQFPNADVEDAAFKKAADAIEKALPLGKTMESLEPIKSGKVETTRARYMKEMGEGGLMEVAGEPSRLLAKKYQGFMQDFLDKKYWPDRNCRKDLYGFKIFSMFNQSYISAYEKDFNKWLPATFKNTIETLESRVKAYESRNTPSLSGVTIE